MSNKFYFLRECVKLKLAAAEWAEVILRSVKSLRENLTRWWRGVVSLTLICFFAVSHSIVAKVHQWHTLNSPPLNISSYPRKLQNLYCYISNYARMFLCFKFPLFHTEKNIAPKEGEVYCRFNQSYFMYILKYFSEKDCSTLKFIRQLCSGLTS